MSLYNIFNTIKKLMTAELIEISLKQSQITFAFKAGEIIYRKDVEELSMLREAAFFSDRLDIWISFAQENPIIVVPIDKENLEENVDATFIRLYKYIDKLAKQVCTCPSLEVVFSDQYIKFFLDKPALTIQDLIDVKTILRQKEETFELNTQRPYMLFINTEAIKDVND